MQRGAAVLLDGEERYWRMAQWQMEQKVTREQFKRENDRSIKLEWLRRQLQGKEVEKVVVYQS